MDEVKMMGSGLAFSDFFMTRPLRIQYPGAFYHITSRGNEKKDIYFTQEDRELFLRILSWVVNRYQWICHAYCLMGNHYHLLIETPKANLAQGMRQLNGIYTQKINESRHRVGHIFQGRYKAFLIEDELYLHAVARYIVLNPVRAKLVDFPEEYRWSSYRQTVGLNRKRDFLTIREILQRFDSDIVIARSKYKDFIQNGMASLSPFVGAKHSILGSQQFLFRTFLRDLPIKSSEFSKEERNIGRLELSDLPLHSRNKNVRNFAIQGAVLSYGYSMAEVGRYLNMHYSRVSRIVKIAKSKT